MCEESNSSADELFSNAAADYERCSRRIYYVRCIYAVVMLFLFVLYRLIPIVSVAILIPLVTMVFWGCDAFRIREEIRKYRAFVKAMAESMGDIVPRNIPREQSWRKIAFFGIDVTPLYAGPILMFTLLVLNPLPNRLIGGSMEFKTSERPFVKVINSYATVRKSWRFRCCNKCPWYCFCLSKCECRRKESEK